MHGGGWWAYMRSSDEKPKVTKELLLRVLTYARGYWWHIAGMLVTILLTTGLSLLTPLIFRNMIDKVIPAKDVNRLILLGVGLLLGGAALALSSAWAIAQDAPESLLPPGFDKPAAKPKPPAPNPDRANAT